MSKLFLMPYIMVSEGAKALSQALGIKRVNKEKSLLRGSGDKILINWGNSSLNHPELQKCTILNRPDAVSKVVNKLTFFKELAESPLVPKPFFSRAEAIDAFEYGEKKLFARTRLTSSGGDGIIVMNHADPDTWVDAPLYTVYIPKKEEFRVHVIKDRNTKEFRRIFAQRKARKHDAEVVNYEIRNLANGFIYANQNVELPEAVTSVVKSIMEVPIMSALDFCALDIVYNERQNRAYVLEANTAPGLAGFTLEVYRDYFRSYL